MNAETVHKLRWLAGQLRDCLHPDVRSIATNMLAEIDKLPIANASQPVITNPDPRYLRRELDRAVTALLAHPASVLSL